jgi:hypothetical protein
VFCGGDNGVIVQGAVDIIEAEAYTFIKTAIHKTRPKDNNLTHPHAHNPLPAHVTLQPLPTSPANLPTFFPSSPRLSSSSSLTTVL